MWQIIGHDWAVRLLSRAIAAGRVAHTYLFTGPESVGKTRLALEFAAAVNCREPEPPCGECISCTRILRGLHPDVLLVEPEKGRLKIDQVRQLQRELSLSPYEGRNKVAILTDFHQATPEAANALLKTLEEPASKVILLLTAPDASLLLPTIVSRSQLLSLRAVPTSEIERALVDQWHKGTEVARTIARLSAGRIGWAIRVIEDPALFDRRQVDLEQLLDLVRAGRAAKIEAAEKLADREDLQDVLQLWQTWWRDVLLVSCGCQDLVVNSDQIEAVDRLAQSKSVSEIASILRGIEAAQGYLGQNVNSRLSLEVLLQSWA